MNVTDESPELELIRRAWEAISHGDLSVLADALAPDARWRAVEDGPWNCEGREAILETMGSRPEGGVRGAIEEASQRGPRVLVAFRPEPPRAEGARPLDDGIAYVGVTFRDGKLVELKACADRAAGERYLTSV